MEQVHGSAQVGSFPRGEKSGTREGPQRNQRCVNSQTPERNLHDVRETFFTQNRNWGIAQLRERRLMSGSSPRAPNSERDQSRACSSGARA